MQNLNIGVNDKKWTDHDLHAYRWFNLGMQVYGIERSYPRIDVDQIWKQYFK